MATQFNLNHAALEDILKSEEVIGAMYDIAAEIVDKTGMPADEYEIEEWVGQNRARVSIKTANIKAHVHEARDHNLVRALGGVQSSSPDPNRLIQYVSAAGRVSMRTQAEIDNYTRNSGSGG